jgi:hypothetical protein
MDADLCEKAESIQSAGTRLTAAARQFPAIERFQSSPPAEFAANF